MKVSRTRKKLKKGLKTSFYVLEKTFSRSLGEKFQFPKLDFEPNFFGLGAKFNSVDCQGCFLRGQINNLRIVF